jgi:hypothetical protein
LLPSARPLQLRRCARRATFMFHLALMYSAQATERAVGVYCLHI